MKKQYANLGHRLNEKERKPKYNNKKVSFFGITFDSQKEAHRFLFLRELEKEGKIRNLQRQVKFEIIPKLSHNGTTIRATNYIADFVYERNGKTIVEDVKGYRGGGAYAIFAIKKKLMYWEHGIWVEEV